MWGGVRMNERTPCSTVVGDSKCRLRKRRGRNVVRRHRSFVVLRPAQCDAPCLLARVRGWASHCLYCNIIIMRPKVV